MEPPGNTSGLRKSTRQNINNKSMRDGVDSEDSEQTHSEGGVSDIDDNGDYLDIAQPQHFSRDNLKQLVSNEVITMSVMVSAKNPQSPLPAMVRFRAEPGADPNFPIWYFTRQILHDTQRTILRQFDYDADGTRTRLRTFLEKLMIYIYGMFREKPTEDEEGNEKRVLQLYLGEKERSSVIDGLSKYIESLPDGDSLKNILSNVTEHKLIEYMEKTTGVITAERTNDVAAADLAVSLTNMALLLSATDKNITFDRNYQSRIPEARRLTGAGSGAGISENVSFQWMMREHYGDNHYSVPSEMSKQAEPAKGIQMTVLATTNMLRGPMPNRSSRADGVVLYNGTPLMYIECKSSDRKEANFGLMTSLNSLNWSTTAHYMYVAPKCIRLYKMEKIKTANDASGRINIHSAVIGNHILLNSVAQEKNDRDAFPEVPMWAAKKATKKEGETSDEKDLAGTVYTMPDQTTIKITDKWKGSNEVVYSSSLEYYLKSTDGPQKIFDTMHFNLRTNVTEWLHCVDALCEVFVNVDHKKAADNFDQTIKMNKLVSIGPGPTVDGKMNIHNLFGFLYVINKKSVDFWKSPVGDLVTSEALKSVAKCLQENDSQKEYDTLMEENNKIALDRKDGEELKAIFRKVGQYISNTTDQTKKDIAKERRTHFVRNFKTKILGKLSVGEDSHHEQRQENFDTEPMQKDNEVELDNMSENSRLDQNELDGSNETIIYDPEGGDENDSSTDYSEGLGAGNRSPPSVVAGSSFGSTSEQSDVTVYDTEESIGSSQQVTDSRRGEKRNLNLSDTNAEAKRKC